MSRSSRFDRYVVRLTTSDKLNLSLLMFRLLSPPPTHLRREMNPVSDILIQEDKSNVSSM